MVTNAVREYRERMYNYGWMRALDVWYDRIDLRKYEERSGEPDIIAAARKRLAERIEAERHKSAPEQLYPKLVSAEGETPRIKDDAAANLPSAVQPLVLKRQRDCLVIASCAGYQSPGRAQLGRPATDDRYR